MGGLKDEALVALPRDRAAELAGLSERQVDYWASKGLVVPAVDHRLSPQRPVRLYGYVELMSLMVAAQLREAGISLQAIRRVVEHLRAEGYGKPLTELRFAVKASRVYFQHPDGTWEQDRRPWQSVLEQVLHLEPLRARIRAAAAREESTVGRLEKRRGAMGSKALIAGTRVPAETVRRYLERRASTADVLEAFPVLKEADVEAVRQQSVAS